MSTNRCNRAKQQTTTTISSPNHLTTTKAHQLFLEDNDNFEMRKNKKIKNLHPPIDMKDAVNKEYWDNNVLSSYNKMEKLSKKITELRKCEFEEVTNGQLNASIIRLPSSTTNGGSVSTDDQTVELVSLNSDNLSTLANKITESETTFFYLIKKFPLIQFLSIMNYN